MPHIFLSWAATAMADLPELQQYYALADRLIEQASKEELIRVKANQTNVLSEFEKKEGL